MIISFNQILQDSDRILSVGRDSVLSLWSRSKEGPIHKSVINQSTVMDCRLSPSLGFAAFGGLNNVVDVFSLEDRKIVVSLSGHMGYVSKIRYAGSDDRIISTSGDGTAILWDVTTNQIIRRFDRPLSLIATRTPASPSDMFSLDWSGSANPNTFLCGFLIEQVFMMDIRSEDPAATFKSLSPCDLNSICYSPNGLGFAVGHDDATCAIFDIRNGPDPLRSVNTSDDESSIESSVNCVSFSGDGRVLFAALDSGRIARWSTVEPKLGEPFQCVPESVATGTRRVTGISTSPDGSWLVSCAWDGAVRVWPADGVE
jgi:WD40 repeat protein